MIRNPLVRLAALFLILAGAAAGCTLPRIPGFGGYYAVTDPATGKTWYASDVRREDSAVEFRDGSTGAWVSLPTAELRRIDKAEFQANTGR